MSDNSNSTDSSASSTNSWTLLSPEEAAVESVGPVDDGTESLGDVPSLSEELAGAAVEFRSGDLSVETVLSEEGHQVCQETSPESSEGPVPSSPARLSPLPHGPLDAPDLDLESQPPVIHEIDTSSPCSDNELLGAIPFVTTMDLGAPLDLPGAELAPPEFEESAPPPTHLTVAAFPELDTPAELEPAGPLEESAVFAAEPEVNVTTGTDAPLPAAAPPSSLPHADAGYVPETTELPDAPVTEEPVVEMPEPATVGSGEAEAEEQVVEEREQVEEEKREEELVEEEATETWESSVQEEPETPAAGGGPDEGLRRRNVAPFEPFRPRTSDDEDEDEEVEFRLAPKKEKPWFSVNKCIVGALILLFLGSLFLAGDFDESDPSDEEQSQDWLSADPQDMKELLDKLTQENQHIAVLEAQLQAQKQELDLALNRVAASGDEQAKADLEVENTKLKEELSSLPELKTELESLRARVTELTQLTVNPTLPPAPQPDAEEPQSEQPRPGPEKREGVKEELRRQKVLLEESRKRLEGMKRDGGGRKHVRENLQEIQKKLTERVESWEERKRSQADHKWGKGKEHWKKEEKKKQQHGKEEKKEWKPQKHNSHKEAWRKHQDEWERKKGERRTDREERRKEKPWHQGKKHQDHHHHHHHHHHQHQDHQQQQQQHHQPRNHNDFWRDQEQKLQRNFKPQLGCSSVDACAAREGLFAVELPEFEELLEGYLGKLEACPAHGKDRVRKLTADFFEDGVFVHDRVRFADFAEDVADLLEDMVDVLEVKDAHALEEEMEEFEREALWKFAATA